jgi:hypothetical protein
MAAAGVQESVIPKVLGHVPEGVTRKHYNLYTYDSDKRAALDEWARHLGRILVGDMATANNVLSSGPRVCRRFLPSAHVRWAFSFGKPQSSPVCLTAGDLSQALGARPEWQRSSCGSGGTNHRARFGASQQRFWSARSGAPLTAVAEDTEPGGSAQPAGESRRLRQCLGYSDVGCDGAADRCGSPVT